MVTNSLSNAYLRKDFTLLYFILFYFTFTYEAQFGHEIVGWNVFSLRMLKIHPQSLLA